MISGAIHSIVHERTMLANLAVGHFAFSMLVRSRRRVAFCLEHPGDRGTVHAQFGDVAAALGVELGDRLTFFRPPQMQGPGRCGAYDSFIDKTYTPPNEIEEWQNALDDAGCTGAVVLRDLSTVDPRPDVSSERWLNILAKPLARAIGSPVITACRTMPFDQISRNAADLVIQLTGSSTICVARQAQPETTDEPERFDIKQAGRAMVFTPALVPLHR
jgi:hypothetical protein